MEESASWRSGLDCPVCRKPYTNSNARAKSKHISYCRKKYQAGPVTRRRACDGCVRSKVRCQPSLGSCSRCISRGVLCTYQGTPNGSSLEPNGHGDSLMSSASFHVAGLSPVSLAAQFPNDIRSNHGSFSAETEMALSNANISAPSFNWEDDIFGPEWSYVPDLSSENHPLGSTTRSSINNKDVHIESRGTALPENSPETRSSVTAPLIYRDTSSLLERRNFSEMGLKLASDISLHILRSYPYMIANQGSVPPFIHPKYQDLAESSSGRPSPLYASLKLAKMVLHGERTNRALIWGLIRIEQERLLNEHHGFTRWEILEALQSLVLYLILRIIEGRHDYTNFDTQLLASINSVCKHITTKYGKLISPDEIAGREIPWKDWVFLESRRRAATTVLVITRILHAQITTPSPAMPEYSHSPAPSPMTLWLAKNETEWATDYTGYLYQNAVHGMLRNGDLVRLKEAAGKQHDRWYAYADSFGLLVTLAADLIN